LSTSSYSLLTPRSGKVACRLVGFGFLLEGGMCAAAMAAVGSGGRSRLQLPPCFRSLLFPSSSLLTQHPRRSACSWSVSVFSLGKGRGFVTCSWLVLSWKRGRGPAACLRKRKGHPPSLLAFIPLLK